jgi:hypothetical protein
MALQADWDEEVCDFREKLMTTVSVPGRLIRSYFTKHFP